MFNRRSVVSAGDLHCSMAGSSAHISVTTGEGRVSCTAGLLLFWFFLKD